MKRILGCCDSSTAIINDKGELLASGDNRFGQINFTKKEYNSFQKIEKAKFLSAGNTSIAYIDENDKLIVQGRINATKENIKFVSAGSTELACIDMDDRLWCYSDLAFKDSKVNVKLVECSDKIQYIDMDNNLKEIGSDKVIKNVKAVHRRYNKEAYIDIDDNLWINNKNTKIKTKKVAFGFDFMVILDSENFIRIQGSNNYKQFGNLPKVLNDITLTDIKATDIACGTYHFVYIDENGLECNGYNFNGQLGTINSKHKFSTHIQPLVDYSIFETYDIKTDKSGNTKTGDTKTDKSNLGTVKADKSCTAKIDRPNLGTVKIDKSGDTKTDKTKSGNVKVNIPKPQKIKDRPSIKLEYGKDFVALIDKQHNLYIKGKNSYRQFGNEVNEFTEFTKIYENVKDVDCGFGHIIVLTNDNDILTSGLNYDGQLGLSHNKNTTELTRTNKKGTEVFAGNWSSAFVGLDGLVYEAGLSASEKLNEFTLRKIQNNIYAL